MYKTGVLKDEISVHEGETGLYDKVGDHLELINTINVNDMAWRTRILDFHNTPLAEVAGILSTTYHIPVEIDTALNNCSVTVRFENQDADAVLNVLKSTLNLTIIKKGKKILDYRERMLTVHNFGKWLLTIFLLAIVAQVLLPQTPDLNQSISMDYENVTLEYLLEQISLRTRLKFSFSPDLVPVKAAINLCMP